MIELTEYSNTVINTLPLLLNEQTREKGCVTIASYMNAMLRKCQDKN